MVNIAAPEGILCPKCGCANDKHAVFCANPQCKKALGEFRYALESMGEQSKWHETLVTKLAGFIGKPHFVALHLIWFGSWIALNAGIFTMIRAFDAYPFGLLALILSIEAILITSVLIISNAGQTKLANTRAELDYEVNVQTYREIQDIMAALEGISERLSALEKRG